MILTADIYAAGGRELLGKADLEIWCGDAFCDSCGDCLACYVGDPCGYDGGFHFFVVYEEDLAEYFGVELTRPEPRP